QELRLGMFADVSIEAGGQVRSMLVPRASIQNVGDRTVVYVADPNQPGRFIEREVRLGGRSGDDVTVLAGVQPGDRVVVEGSFLVRAERERLGLRATDSSQSSATAQATSAPAENHSNVQEAKVF